MVLLALLLLTVASATGAAGPAAVLWISIVFAISFGLARSFHHELADDQLTGLALAPVDRAAIYLGKAAANLLIVAAAETVIIAVFAVLFNVDVGRVVLPLIAVIAAGTIGLVAIGTLLGAMVAVTRLREALVPMLLLPVGIPAVLAAVRATEHVLDGRPLGGVQGEMQLLAAFALLCIAVPVLVFESVLEE
jgi:heme exporter protein B